MSNTVTFVASNGTVPTIGVEDKTASLDFWDKHFSLSYMDDDEDYYFQSNLDLMGNPRKNSFKKSDSGSNSK
jgi:hypothetical protein